MKNLKFVLPVLIFLFATSIFAQTNVTLPNLEDLTVGDEVVIPVTSGPLPVVASVTLFISFDKNVLEYVGVENNPFTGATINDNGGKIGVAWFSLSTVAITDKIFDIRFKYLGGNTDLEFTGTNQITNMSAALDINYVNGSIIDNSVPPAREIELITPNGGESWEKGSSHTISWTDNFTENVKIELWKADSFLENIIESTESDGSYSWTLNNSLSESSDFKVKVISVDSADVSDMSDADFTVAPAPPLFITLTNPNGGENWEQSTTHNITWTDNIDGNVKIELLKSSSYDSDITATTESDGSFAWTIPGDLTIAGDYSVKITSIDSVEINDASNATFSVIEFNNPPVVSDIPNQTINKGDSFATINLDDYVEDLNNVDTEITWTVSGNSNLTVTITNRVATVTSPNALWTGSETITFTAKDPQNAADTDQAVFTINSVVNPDDPNVTIPDLIAVPGTEITVPVLSAPLAEVASVTMFISFDSSVLEFVGFENNPFTGNFLANDNGGEIAISWFSLSPVTITDKFFDIKFNYIGGNSDIEFTGTNQVTDMSSAISMNFVDGSVKVDPFNPNNPSLTISNVYGVVGNEVTVPVLSDSLAEVASLTMFVAFDTDVLEFVGVENNPFTGNFLLNDNGGELAISWFSLSPITITDKLFDIKFNYLGGNSDIEFTGTNQITDMSSAIQVNFINGNISPMVAPVLSEIPDQTVIEGEAFAQISLDDYVTDANTADADLIWNISGQAELIVVVDENRIATVTIPNSEWNGSETLLFVVSDSEGGTDSANVVFSVTSDNDAPVVSAIGNRTISEGGNFETINLDDFVEDVDNTDEEITWSFEGNSELGITIENRIATVTVPNEDWFGVDTVSFIAADPSSMKDTAMVIFTVENVNDPVVITEIQDTVKYDIESPIEINIWDYVSDSDDEVNTLEYDFSTSNDSLIITYDNETGIISIDEIDGFLGEVEVTIEISDASGEKVISTFKVNIFLNVSVYDEKEIPNEYSLYQNYPNPFNPTTKIAFGLPQSSNVKIEIFDILGNKISTVLESQMSAGNHSVQFNAINLPSGTYFYRIETSKFVDVRKMLLLK
ncbi:MAG: T9SS type A sorting domain-containing protein [Melioribacteraceae bacterium]|nr:T9SS type A sorting domain-containing protein [Melioribacteraceae bacterium]